MPATETKQILVGDFEIKAKDEGARTFEGALSSSHLDQGDGRVRDIVWPNAYKRTMDHFKAAKDPYIPLVDSHQYGSIFNVYGHLLDGEERMTGKTLRYEKADGGTLEVPEMFFDTKWQVIDGPDGDRLLDRLRPGSVRKMSIGYGAGSHDFVDLTVGKARNLREVKLREGSLVVFPMNEVADVDRASVKALIAEIEDRLDGDLTDEDREALQKARDEIDRALQPAQPEGLAPDDPKRLAVETLARRLRTSNLRRLATR